MNDLTDDPFEILGVSESAGEEAVRARYLELVKEFPPERDPERFRQVQAAYSAAKDPLKIASRLLQFPDLDDPPEWSDAINQHEKRPPNLTAEFLLSLGNRNERYCRGSNVEEDSQQVYVDPAHE